MSLAFVGRVYSSLKGFYNEINSATLTGAIDVVIVKQKDGSYHSSPFHVRFGKLGVLRAREKIVDIEINGQPVGLHMKLGEAGEAFFVQEFTEDGEEAEFPAYLATSPIESCDELMAEGVARLRAERHQQQLQEELQQRTQQVAQQQSQPAVEGESGARELSSTSVHLQLQQPQQVGGSAIQPEAKAEDHVSLSLDLTPAAKDVKSDSSYEEEKNKGKPRRKVLKKKKQKHGGARCSPRSQSVPEGLGLADHDHIFDMEVTESTSEDEEMAAYSLGASRSVSLDMKKMDIKQGIPEVELTIKDHRMSTLDSLITPFSDPEISPPQSPQPTRPPSPKSDTEVDRQHTEENQQKLLQDDGPTWDWGQFPTPTPLNSPVREPTKERIDSVLERQDSEKVTSGGLLSLWMRQKSKKASTIPVVVKKDEGNDAKGMYLDDLASLEDPEIAKLYLGSPRFQSIREREDDSESGRGASLPQSPHSVDGAIGGTVSFLESEVRHLGTVALSLCGGLSDPEGMTLDKFMKKVITFDDLVEQPALLSNPDLVVKIRDGYYNWTTAAPMVVCEMAFNKQLPESTVSNLTKKHMPKKTLKKKGSGLSWFSWRSSTNQNADGGSEEVPMPSTSTQLSVTIPISDQDTLSSKVSEGSVSPLFSPATSPPTSAHGTPRKQQAHRRDVEAQSTETDTDNSEKESSATPVHIPVPPAMPGANEAGVGTGSPSIVVPSAVESVVVTPGPVTVIPSSDPIAVPVDAPSSHSSGSPSQPSETSPSLSPSPTQPIKVRQGPGLEEVKVSVEDRGDKYFKTLRLTSEQVSKLNLREGQNEITFSVTTQYQGTTRCVSHIYLWNYDDKIVISDIDGTITKSDVMGQILPLIGRDWSQSGVAQLFTHLSNNGYKLLYLSARAIGQSRITKDLLKSIRQGNLVLPDGPLLLNPTSLISAFHREVIVKNPEEFKINCLKDIAELFPTGPFYAGFGNKINDVMAYRALQIPSYRIFTINPQGQLRHEFSHTFLSSYSKMSDIADHFFPPINASNRSMSVEYSAVNYWRTPPPDINQVDLASLTTVCEVSTTTSTNTTTSSTTTAAASTASGGTVATTITITPTTVIPAAAEDKSPKGQS